MHKHSNEHNEDKGLMIIGTDADARLALDIANMHQVVVYGFMTDDDEQLLKEINDIAVIMRVDAPEGKKFLDKENVEVIVAERDIEKRKNLLRKVLSRKVEIANLVFPDAVISPYAAIGKGNVIGSGFVLMPNSTIGSHNSIHAGVKIDTDVTIEDLCTIQSSVSIGRGAKIAEEVTIGMGAVIFAGITVGKGAFIGPGSVVLKNVPAGGKVFGNPAKEV